MRAVSSAPAIRGRRTCESVRQDGRGTTIDGCGTATLTVRSHPPCPVFSSPDRARPDDRNRRLEAPARLPRARRQGETVAPTERPKARSTRAVTADPIRFLRPWGLDLRDADGSTILIIHDFPYLQIGLDGRHPDGHRLQAQGLARQGQLQDPRRHGQDVKLRLNARARNELKKKGKLAIRVHTDVRLPDGKRIRTSRKLTIKRPATKAGRTRGSS
jgi:hypothetical protein